MRCILSNELNKMNISELNNLANKCDKLFKILTGLNIYDSSLIFDIYDNLNKCQDLKKSKKILINLLEIMQKKVIIELNNSSRTINELITDNMLNFLKEVNA